MQFPTALPLGHIPIHTAKEEPQLHSCMHGHTNGCIHISFCSNDIFTTSLSCVTSVSIYTHTSPACVCTHIFTTYNLKALFRGKSFIDFFLVYFFNLSLWQNFPPSFHLPFQCVTYLSWNKLCNSVCLSTHSCYPWLIYLYLYFGPPV